MEYILINSSEVRMPKTFIRSWMNELCSFLKKKKILKKKQVLTIIFLKSTQAKSLNFRFRGKNYATDILSFEGHSDELFGELVLCPKVLKRQAKEQGLEFNQELGYMLTHGLLHLMGYEHEKSRVKAKEMFQLQDEIYEYLWKKFWI